jgi:hypothetical protein
MTRNLASLLLQIASASSGVRVRKHPVKVRKIDRTTDGVQVAYVAFGPIFRLRQTYRASDLWSIPRVGWTQSSLALDAMDNANLMQAQRKIHTVSRLRCLLPFMAKAFRHLHILGTITYTFTSSRALCAKYGPLSKRLILPCDRPMLKGQIDAVWNRHFTR